MAAPRGKSILNPDDVALWKIHNKTIDDLKKMVDDLTPSDDEIDGLYCLANGHVHRNRYAEAICSLRFQMESKISELENKIDILVNEIEGRNANQG